MLHPFKLLLLLILSLWLMGCADDKRSNEASVSDTDEDQPVDPEFTRQLEQQLRQSTLALSDTERQQVEEQQSEILENLTEADRQQLIDQTLEETSTLAEEDADKVLEAIEDAVEASQ